MSHPPLYEFFQRTISVSDGKSVYDFLGGAIDASYKHAWDKNVAPQGQKLRPNYPGLSEWTADWIASLIAAKTAGETFRVVELGAGYGQWMVTGILAYRALRDGKVHGVAVEADPTHFDWLQKHTHKNVSHLENVHLDLIHGAAGKEGEVSFPVVIEPSRDYGASYARSSHYEQTITVPCFSVGSLFDRFDHKPVDLLHIDIQGAEVDLIDDPDFSCSLANTRIVLIGTHASVELHSQVRTRLLEAGYEIAMDWPRSSTFEIEYGKLSTNDGALLAIKPETLEAAEEIFDFASIIPRSDT